MSLSILEQTELAAHRVAAHYKYGAEDGSIEAILAAAFKHFAEELHRIVIIHREPEN